jgi:two-component system phosphate regulon response regulator PhoB
MIRILIADPDSASRKALALLVQRKLSNPVILEAGDVETLIRMLADNPPDLLLLDWKLYGSPAPETCRLLQKAYSNLKILLLSVDANNAAIAKEAGAMFVYKGASPDELINMLKPLLTEDESEVDQPHP